MKLYYKLLWIVFALLAISIGLYPTIYFIVDRNFGLLQTKNAELLSDLIWNTGFYMHIILGGVAMLTGWTQFSRKLRFRNVKIHRLVGKIYVLTALLSSIAGFYIALFATGGLIAILGFTGLAVMWFSTTATAYIHIRNGRIDDHEQAMIFSYAVCFAAVTLRIWLPILISVFNDFTTAYTIVSWLCWVPNIFVAWLIVRRMELKKIR